VFKYLGAKDMYELIVTGRGSTNSNRISESEILGFFSLRVFLIGKVSNWSGTRGCRFLHTNHHGAEFAHFR
jgi:hypothetical protein